MQAVNKTTFSDEKCKKESLDVQKLIGEFGLKHYSRVSRDIRYCPNKDCNYFGFVDLGHLS
jgi:hypothetical protein